MLSALERQSEIALLAKVSGHVSVAQLAEHFEVTPETVRRDLKALEKLGRLSRVHGGAVSASATGSAETEFASNASVRPEEKSLIADCAWKRIQQDGGISSVSIDSGSTTLEFAKILATATRTIGARSLTVITNSLPVSNLAADYGMTSVHTVGGRIRPLTRAIVGDNTVAQIERLRTDLAVMGTNGISLTHGCSTPDPSEAAVKAAMVRSCRTVMVLCDSAKLGEEYLVTFAPISDIDIVVTDSGADEDFVVALTSQGIEVLIP